MDKKNEIPLYLGIEIGSTRIKSVLIDGAYTPVASGSYQWENQFEDGLWTYPLSLVWEGIQKSYLTLKRDFLKQQGKTLKKIEGIGISAMMHGYLPFDKENRLLVPFRTWRNTNTDIASKELTDLLDFMIPHRWSAAHLYQAIIDKEKHVHEVDFLTTLSGYVHWQLTGEKVIGVGDASGMFPINSKTSQFDEKRTEIFDQVISSKGFSKKLLEISPKILLAGMPAGILTKEGAKKLDPTGELGSGSVFCPPEGDAGTGMVATNSIKPLTGNISAGTSIFAMVVLEKNMETLHPEIDMVTTPMGAPVAMVHCNNCSTDIDHWINLFREVSTILGGTTETNELYTKFYQMALLADKDCGNLISYNYFSGEPITHTHHGVPLLLRSPDSNLTIPNFMRNLLFSAISTLKKGMDILTLDEKVHIERLMGHGGFFKTPLVGQRLMSGALEIPVSVMKSASEGGAWGIALLSAFVGAEESSLEDFLNEQVFKNADTSTCIPLEEDTESFCYYIKRWEQYFPVEKMANG